MVPLRAVQLLSVQHSRNCREPLHPWLYYTTLNPCLACVHAAWSLRCAYVLHGRLPETFRHRLRHSTFAKPPSQEGLTQNTPARRKRANQLTAATTRPHGGLIRAWPRRGHSRRNRSTSSLRRRRCSLQGPRRPCLPTTKVHAGERHYRNTTLPTRCTFGIALSSREQAWNRRIRYQRL